MTNFPKTKAVRWRDEAICDLLGRIGRLRPLNEEEEMLLRRTLRRMDAKQANWRWSTAEDRAVWGLIMRRIRHGPPRPYVVDDDVRALAARLGRSYMAVHRRMERLRKRADPPLPAPRQLFKRAAANDALNSPAWTVKNLQPME